MHPIVAPLVAKVSFRLGDLVCVVRECVVNTAAVNVKVLTEVLHGDAGALNMPAGVTNAPGTVPLKLLIVKLGLCEPENEVSLVSLVVVLFNALAHAILKVFLLKVVENVVLLKL